MEIIHLTPADDLVSLIDYLNWATERRVLFVLPNGSLTQISRMKQKNSAPSAVHPVAGLDLVRLRRRADDLRLEIGLVTVHKPIARQARALGIPVFRDEKQAKRNSRGWRRGRNRQEWVGLPNVGGRRLADWVQQNPQRKRDPSAVWAQLSAPVPPLTWVMRYSAVVLFFLMLALFVIGFFYLLPTAIVTLPLATETIQASRPIMADPAVGEVGTQTAVIPARTLQTTAQWQESLPTTGLLLRPTTPAQGDVIFTNLLDAPVVIEAGTVLSTSNGILFETVQAVLVAGAEGSTAQATVVARELGPVGNVQADAIVNLPDDLSRLVTVRNSNPLTGGAVEEVTTVSADDRERLRSQAVQSLQAVALSELQIRLTEREFLARESIRIETVLTESYSHSEGEQAQQLTLKIEAQLTATAVDTTLAYPLVLAGLTVPDGFTLVTEALQFERGEILGVDEAGRVQFVMEGTAVMIEQPELAPVFSQLEGQPLDIAIPYLQQNLPLTAEPSIEVWPLWFERIPYQQQKIETVILPDW